MIVGIVVAAVSSLPAFGLLPSAARGGRTRHQQPPDKALALRERVARRAGPGEGSFAAATSCHGTLNVRTHRKGRDVCATREEDEPAQPVRRGKSEREVLNLPAGCKVEFDTRVIEVFERQLLDPRFATRHNIARILIYQYRRMTHKLRHQPSRAEIDRNCLLDSRLYNLVFGSWKGFLKVVEPDTHGVA